MKRVFERWLAPWSAAVLLLGSIVGTSLALASDASAQQTAEIEFLANEVAVYGDTVDHFEAMNVRIANPEGDLVLSVRSNGDPVVWSPSAGDPDGLYRFEVVVITLDPEAAGEEEDTGERLSRQSGSFELRDGAIMAPEDEHSGLWDGVLRVAGRVLEAVGEAVIPSAHALDLTASSAEPVVRFEDTTNGIGRAARLQADVPDTADADRVSFQLEGRTNTNEIIDIDTDLDGDQSIVIDRDGHIALAGNSVFIDRSNARVGIGTTIPQEELHISAANFAGIRLEDNGATPQVWDLQVAPDFFQLSDRTALSGFGTTPFLVRNGAGTATLVIGLDARVGVGGELEPASTLHVNRFDGTAQVLVEETSTSVANRTLIQLTNNGRPQVRLSNADSGVNWVTGMGTDDSYIIRRGSNEYRFTNGGRVRWFLAGDPVPRFDYNNNGNLTIFGTLTENSDVNTKRNIVPVDGAAVLARVAALPVSTWTYKHDESGARHLGPMAQDFHAAFGLGENDTRVSPRDVAGVALAAIQALMRQSEARLREKDTQIAALSTRLAEVEAKLGARD